MQEFQQIAWETWIEEAQVRIQDFVLHTPLFRDQALGSLIGSPVWLKCEQFQPMGAFKLRGAANALLKAPPADRARGAVTYSTGNHGLAVAYMCRTLGVPAVVCVSSRVPDRKISALRALGAQIVVDGEGQDDALKNAKRIAQEDKRLLIEPFDDPAVIAGQGTIGLEILGQLPDVQTVLIPLSGGGLAAGVAAIIKSRQPSCQIVGVSMNGAAVMYESLKQGHPVQMPEVSTLADSLQGGIGLDNQYTFAMVQHWLDDVCLVSETQILEAMGYLAVRQGLLVEGAAAVPVAYLLHHAMGRPLGPTVAILTGRNVEIEQSCQAMRNYRHRVSDA